MMNFAAYLAEAATTFTLDINTIVLGVIGLIPAILTALIAMRQKEQKDSLAEVHTAVNSSKTVLENKVDDLIKQNVALTKTVATLEENKRGTEMAKAVATVPPVVVMPVGQPQAVPMMGTWGGAPAAKAAASDSSGTPLENAISDLTEAAKDTVEAADETLDKTAVLKDKVPKQP